MEDNFEGEENQNEKKDKEEMFKIFDKENKSLTKKENKKDDLEKKFEEKDKIEMDKKVQQLKQNLSDANPKEKEKENEEEEEDKNILAEQLKNQNEEVKK